MQVVARTNVGGLSIPKSARVRHAVGRTVTFQSDIWITNVLATSSDAAFIPHAGGETLITDYRFAARTPPIKLNYVASNWMSFDKAEALYRQKAAQWRPPSKRAAKPLSKAFACILALLIILPAAAGLYRFTTGKTQEQT